MYVKPSMHSVGIPKAFANVTAPPDDLCEEVCVDFEGFARGTIITGQIADITISTKTKSGDPMPGFPAMIFDSSSPTGGDRDLGTPNEIYNRPKIWSRQGLQLLGRF